MFKSKIEVREFAIKQAVELLGRGTPANDVVGKATEIESYIIGKADLPEVYNEIEAAGGLLGNAFDALRTIAGESRESAEAKASKKK